MQRYCLFLIASITFCTTAAIIEPAIAQSRYDPGANLSEIRIGNTMPYSGPLSAYGLIGRTIAAYFRKVNAEGGINQRKINFISYAAQDGRANALARGA